MVKPVEGSPFTPEQLQWFIDHKSDSKVPDIIACATITAFFSTVFVVLRLFGRWRINGSLRLHVSDWLVAVAWIFFILCAVFFALITLYGGGRHVIYITNTYRLQVFSIITEGTYGVAMGFLKFSILSLYGSIFPSKTFHRYLWGTAVFILGWMLTSSLGAILQCIPIAKAYDNSLDGYCIHYGTLSLVVGILNVITDFVILALPIPLVLKLNTSAEKKRVIIITFAAGSSVAIASIVRLVYSLDVGTIDGSWTSIPAAYTSCVELTVGFLVVSIPVYRKLYRKTMRGDAGDSMAWSYKSDRVPLNGKYPYNSKSVDSNNSVGYKGAVMTNTRGGGSTREITRVESNQSGRNKSPGHTIMIKATDDGYTQTSQKGSPGINITEDVDLVRLANRNGAWVRVEDEDSSLQKTG